MALPIKSAQINQLLTRFPLTGGQAADELGYPRIHAAAFTLAAHRQESVIISREVGKVCRDLIMEGYDSKGFRIKTKTCNWGPMAGFVCVDPRLTKYGVRLSGDMAAHTANALHDLDGAGWQATTIPIKISRHRLSTLINPLNCIRAIRTVEDGYEVWHVTHHNGPDGLRNMIFALVQEKDDPNLFGVCFDNKETPPAFQQDTLEEDREYTYHIGGAGLRYERMLGLANPDPPYDGALYHLNAVIGDYDLFAVWPYAGARVPYDPRSEDRRFGHPQHPNIAQLEHPQLGNITDRVHLVAGLLNSMFTGADGRQMVHHSDEGGRPGIQGVDLPLIGFVPFRQGTVVIGIRKDGNDWNNFTKLCRDAGFTVVLHPAWQ